MYLLKSGENSPSKEVAVLVGIVGNGTVGEVRVVDENERWWQKSRGEETENRAENHEESNDKSFREECLVDRTFAKVLVHNTDSSDGCYDECNAGDEIQHTPDVRAHSRFPIAPDKLFIARVHFCNEVLVYIVGEVDEDEDLRQEKDHGKNTGSLGIVSHVLIGNGEGRDGDANEQEEFHEPSTHVSYGHDNSQQSHECEEYHGGERHAESALQEREKQ